MIASSQLSLSPQDPSLIPSAPSPSCVACLCCCKWILSCSKRYRHFLLHMHVCRGYTFYYRLPLTTSVSPPSLVTHKHTILQRQGTSTASLGRLPTHYISSTAEAMGRPHVSTAHGCVCHLDAALRTCTERLATQGHNGKGHREPL